MTDKEIANLYHRLLICHIKRMKPHGKAQTMKRFALENDLYYTCIVREHFTEHWLWYKKELVMLLKVEV